MILKCISGRGATALGNTLKYIFRGKNPERENVNWANVLKTVGVKFNELDIRYLEQEAGDAELMRELATFNGDIKAFLENQVLFLGKQNLKSKSLEEYKNEILANEAARLRTSSRDVTFLHTVLSFSPEDAHHVTGEMLQAFANKYLQLIGRNAIAIAVGHIHENRHIHVILGRTRTNGLSVSVRHADLRNIKEGLTKFQLERYGKELQHSLPQHGKNKSQEWQKSYKKTDERHTSLEKIQSKITGIMGHIRSREELETYLKSEGLSIYSRNGRDQGIIDANGIKYRTKHFEHLSNILSELTEKENVLKELNTKRATTFKREENTIELSDEEKILQELEALRPGSESTMESLFLDEYQERKEEIERGKEEKYEEDDETFEAEDYIETNDLNDGE